MNYDLFMSGIQFHIISDIEVDFGENQQCFMNPVLPIKTVYYVFVNLVDEFTLPEQKPYKEETCCVWDNNGCETRLYNLDNYRINSILSILKDHVISISILKKLWRVRIQSFRIWSYLHLERILLRENALILHSASIISHGKAILFTAPSETGKTTQTDIWHRNDPLVEDLNGDRTILQYDGNGWMACGIPISGTSNICVQKAVPVSAVVIVRRSVLDSVSYPSISKLLPFLYGQLTIHSRAEDDVQKALSLLEQLVLKEKVVQLNCTMNDEAYHVLYNELFADSENI